MTTRTDSELLNSFVRNRDEDAFDELARRYVDMVHAAATRQTRDPHLADDVTQAVFMVLARRAREIRDRGLAGWLILTTRNASLAALKAKSRREYHERKAAAMKDPVQVPVDSSSAVDINTLLDSGLAKMAKDDRTIISLRYLQGKPFADVATALGITEDTAQKRTSRAMDKLRDYFARNGVTTDLDAIPAALLLHASHLAPASLTASITGHASISSSAPAGMIAKLVVKAMTIAQLKTVGLVCAGSIAVAGAISVPIYRQFSRESAPVSVANVVSVAVAPPVVTDISPATLPTAHALDIANVRFGNDRPAATQASNQQNVEGIDPSTRRGDAAAGYIKSTQGNSTTYMRIYSLAPGEFAGQRVRLTAWLKSRDIANWGAMRMLVYGKNNRILADDDMRARGITGTNEWEQHQIVEDIPNNAGLILIMYYLRGTGELWSDGFRLESIGRDVPTTDDQNWHVFSPDPTHYSAKLDRFTIHNGHETVCITGSSVPRGSWANYDRNDRTPTKYLGKRIHISAWVKSERLTSTAGLMIQVLGAHDTSLASEGQRGNRPIKGTSDWTRYDAFTDVPKDAHGISTGITMNGNGKLWIDDVQLEVIEPQ